MSRFPKINHNWKIHPTEFDGNRHCGNEDIVVSEFHMILQEHVIKGSCNFADSNHPAKFDGQKHSGSGGIMFLFCHVILG